MLRSLVFLAATLLSSAAVAADIAVVLLHDKQADANGAIAPLVKALQADGMDVHTPDMPWSKTRLYNGSFLDALKETNAVIRDIQAKNEDTLIFLGGHGLGANMAVAYAALQDYVDGVLAIAPSHTPEHPRYTERLHEDVRRALQDTVTMKADVPAEFTDLVDGKAVPITVTPNNYLSYFGSITKAVLPDNAKGIWEGVSLLWVVGRKDPIYALGKDYAYAKAPFYETNAYIEVDADHDGTPASAAPEVIQWIHKVAADLTGATEGIEKTKVKPGVNLEGLGL